MEESRTFAIVLTAAIASLAIALSALAAETLRAIGIDVPYLCFLAAIVGCCAIGGWALARWALIFSVLGLWHFFAPPRGFAWPKYSDATHFLVFIAVSYFTCWIIDGQRRANDALSRDNVALGYKVSALLKRIKAR